jgi:phage shock protein PspC (stress-responsive transcriptional regulator)
MKKLYRNTNKGKIAGVCVGLAYHLNVDVALVRAGFLIALFCGWGGIAYLALWAVTPKLKNKRR